MNAQTRGLLGSWKKLALKAADRHNAACDHFERLDVILGQGSALLAAVVGSGIFVTLQHGTSFGLRLAAGGIAMAAAAASGIQTSAKYGTRAERHRQASRHYGAVARQVDEILALSPATGELEQRLDAIRKLLDDAGAMAPNVPPKIWEERSWADRRRNKRRKKEK